VSSLPPRSRRARRLVAAAALVVVTATSACSLTPRLGGTSEVAATRGIGVFRQGGTTPATVGEWERWVGRRLTHVSTYFSEQSWDAQLHAADWFTRQWQGSGKTIAAGVPIIVNSGGSLRAGANGAYDGHWRNLASTLVRNGQERMILRLGWEFNGTWYKWSAVRDPGAFADYWRRIVTTMRSVPGASGLRFDWNPGIGPANVPLAAYPGDAYVDIIGLDIYDRSFGPRGANDAARWADFMERPYGLRWHREFARAHGKPMSFPEWGISDVHVGGATHDNAGFVHNMADWFASNDVAYQSYFDVDKPGDGNHKLMTGQFPRSGGAYRSRF